MKCLFFMKHGSLFSGIGGFDLAAEWMGWQNVFHCEWMPFPRKILHHYWPKAKSYEDITKTDFTIHRGEIDILTGGFPCQPYSSAGKRLGKEDERHLWPHMLRAIQEIEPSYVVGENVRGLTNWNGGVVFEEVCADLENCGYEVQPILLPACAVGAPHRRDRIWFVAKKNVANTMSIRLQQCKNEREMGERQEEICKQRSEFANGIEANGKISNATDSNSIRQHKCECDNEINASEGRINALNDINENVINSECIRWNEESNDNGKFKKTQQKECRQKQFSRTDSSSSRWRGFPSQSFICGGNDGISYGLDGITFSKWRQESIKGYGNAIVPQVALQIFKVIEKLNKLK